MGSELQDEILYYLGPSTHESQGGPDDPLWIMPHVDWNRETQGPLSQVMRQQPKLSFLDISLNQRNNTAPSSKPEALPSHGMAVSAPVRRSCTPTAVLSGAA